MFYFYEISANRGDSGSIHQTFEPKRKVIIDEDEKFDICRQLMLESYTKPSELFPEFDPQQLSNWKNTLNIHMQYHSHMKKCYLKEVM